MIRKYNSFEELVTAFKDRKGIALRYTEDGKNITEITYTALADMIISEMYHVKAECSTVEVLNTEHTPESIVEIFANVMAGCDIVMSNIAVPAEYAERASEAAELAKDARESMRDGQGRVIGAKGEGELLFLTSGTTSRSKIVRLTSRSLCASAWSGQSMLPCSSDDVILSILPFSHVFGFVCSMLWGLAYGATIALGRGVAHLAEDAQLLRPTILPTVPTLMDAILASGDPNSELRTVLIGAAPCRPEITAQLREMGIDVYLGYGLTETSSGIAISRDLDEPEAMYPCPGSDISIESDGEVTVATSCMMEGYIGDIPMFDGDRFFTGDLGWFDEKGRLHLKGRKKDVLVMADGTKIFCPEYEEDLAELSGFVDIAISLIGSDPVLIAGSLTDDPAISEDIRSKLLRIIAKYNADLQPSQRISDVIVRKEALPRTATGKLRRYELQEQFS